MIYDLILYLYNRTYIRTIWEEEGGRDGWSYLSEFCYLIYLKQIEICKLIDDFNTNNIKKTFSKIPNRIGTSNKIH